MGKFLLILVSLESDLLGLSQFQLTNFFLRYAHEVLLQQTLCLLEHFIP